MNNPLTPVEALQREIDHMTRLDIPARVKARYLAYAELAKADAVKAALEDMEWHSHAECDLAHAKADANLETARNELYEALQR